MTLRKIQGWFLALLLLSAGLGAEEPSALYLSWTRDPTSTMVIRWHTSKKDRETEVSYQKEGEKTWKKREGTAALLQKSSLLIHSTELTDLEEDTTYLFKVGEEETTYKFRTCPKSLKRPLRFAVAGDAYFYLYLLRKMNTQIAAADPDFVVVGGDIAYAHGHKSLFKGRDWEAKRWGTFLQEWQKQMVTSDGRLIPMVVVVGNHDVKSRQIGGAFYQLFPFPQENIPYRTLDFGSYFSLFLLDTNHTYPIDGEQSKWLDSALSARMDVPFKIPVYHVAAYPSVYQYEGSVPTKIRSTWVPLFEKYGVKLAFENHNHAYKRSHPIKAGKIDPEGITYLGDGAWGVSPRKPRPLASSWYLAKAAQLDCFWLITLGQEGYTVRSYDEEGSLIEELPSPRKSL
ncbi:MAG: metallophosphoesterase family protein [Chlamydiales bacterium]|nr:metallophosphoesterase family protein [Chlamydiales bacterium]